MESSPEEKDLGDLVNEKLDRSPQCALAAQKDNHLGDIKRKCDPQVKGSGSPHPLPSHEIPAGILPVPTEVLRDSWMGTFHKIV